MKQFGMQCTLAARSVGEALTFWFIAGRARDETSERFCRIEPQMERLETFVGETIPRIVFRPSSIPEPYRKSRVDDRRPFSGMTLITRNVLRWRDARKSMARTVEGDRGHCGAAQAPATLYIRWKHHPSGTLRMIC